MKTMMAAIFATSMLLSSAASGNAAILIQTGTFGEEEDTVIYTGISSAPPGQYKFVVDLSSAAKYFYGDASKTVNYNFYCDFHDGGGLVQCGGDDNPMMSEFKAVSPIRYEAIVTVEAPYSVYGTGISARTDYYDTCCNVDFDIGADAIGTYKLSYGAVPEPATWSLMIIGMGGTGLIMRRRHRTVGDRSASA